jgi:hypothetical protein
VPTTENIAKIALDYLHQGWSKYIDAPGTQVQRVHIQETDRNGFEILAGASRPDSSSEIAERVIVHA